MDYKQELEFAKNLAREAGELMRSGIGVSPTTWKADHTPVTEADLAINTLVIENVQEMFPEDGILGEEASYKSDRPRKWVVDPIDGTQPFDVGAPLSVFSLGLVVDEEPVLGLVYDPYLDKLYTAIKGQGAFMNEERIAVIDSSTLDKQYVFISSRMGGDHLTAGQAMDAFIEAGAKCFNFRSVVYGFMRVAAGKAAVALAGPSYPWDFTAAMVILGEAGATFTDLDGRPVVYSDAKQGAIACSPHLHDEILKMVLV